MRLEGNNTSPNDVEEFFKWLRLSPMHVREYLRAESLWSTMEYIDFERRIDVDGLIGAEDSNVIPIETPVDSCSTLGNTVKVRSWRWRPIAAVAAATLVFAFVWIWHQAANFHYETGTGEQRRLVLSDGSIVDMNTQSEIEVRFSNTERHIRLLKGEAFFKVAKDAERPFLVTSDIAIVRALGTEFNVYRQSDQTLVSVIEGRISVANTSTHATDALNSTNATVMGSAPIELSAGDQAEMAESGEIYRTVLVSEEVIAWRHRRLIFHDQPLAEVVAEFNRYNTRKLRIEDSTLGLERISAVFDADRPGTLVQFLTLNLDVEVSQDDDGHVVIGPGE